MRRGRLRCCRGSIPHPVLPFLPGEERKEEPTVVISKGQANTLLRKMYLALKGGEVKPRLKKIQTQHLGYCYFNGEIEVDPLQAPIQTFIHELLHFVIGSTDEGLIEKLEDSLCHHLTERQLRNLWIAIGNAL